MSRIENIQNSYTEDTSRNEIDQNNAQKVFNASMRDIETSAENTLKDQEGKHYAGVVGYCPPSKFDEVEARRMICEAYDQITQENPGKEIIIVSGLTNVGVLAIAYKEAVERGWQTVGIACKQAEEHELFPVTEKAIVGDNWGDESETFLSAIDSMIRIGTGPQSVSECAVVAGRGQKTYEFDLPMIS